LINKEVKNWKKAVCELSQSSSLSLDGWGYPYCTSSDTSINGVRSAVNLSEIDTTIWVLKFILTKVWGWRLVTKFEDHRIEEVYRKKESEIWGTTERDRDIWWLNLVELRKSLSTNAVDIMFMTKMDALNTLKDVLKKATKQENPMLKICDYYKKDLIVWKWSSDQDIEKIYSGILNSNEQLSGISPEYIERAFPTINLSGVKNTRNLDANTKDIIDTIVSKLNFTWEVMLWTWRWKDDVMFY
jgi:adenylosuccinate synthase